MGSAKEYLEKTAKANEPLPNTNDFLAVKGISQINKQLKSISSSVKTIVGIMIFSLIVSAIAMIISLASISRY